MPWLSLVCQRLIAEASLAIGTNRQRSVGERGLDVAVGAVQHQNQRSQRCSGDAAELPGPTRGAAEPSAAIPPVGLQAPLPLSTLRPRARLH